MTIDEAKADAQIAVIGYPNAVYNDLTAYLAVPTKEETETFDQYSENYGTLSEEIGIQIIKGEVDIDTEWDSKVIAPLEEAGMNELLDVYTARSDRYWNYSE